jgi:hypothetical protein
MFIELIMFVLVAAFVTLTALGHVLLAAAIVRCVREDLPAVRRRASVGRKAVPVADGLEALVAR